MSRWRPTVLAAVFLACVAGAGAHAPTTAIGRAVEAFGSVSVSYEPGAAVSDIEAGNFPRIVGSNPKVAFMPASASSELAGGPNAIAAEVASEAKLDGTLIVLIGTNLGWWSNDIDDDRFAELVRDSRMGNAGSPAAVVRALVQRVQTEPTGGTSWALIAIALLVLGSGAFVVLHQIGRRRSPASS